MTLGELCSSAGDLQILKARFYCGNGLSWRKLSFYRAPETHLKSARHFIEYTCPQCGSILHTTFFCIDHWFRLNRPWRVVDIIYPAPSSSVYYDIYCTAFLRAHHNFDTSHYIQQCLEQSVCSKRKVTKIKKQCVYNLLQGMCTALLHVHPADN